MDPIRGFFGPYRFLSNFYIEPDGTHVEGEYQASKVVDWSLCVMSPKQAKAVGRRMKIRDDWEEIKLDVMFELVNQKFHDHPMLGRQLLSTGRRYLEETNDWGDVIWGVCRGVGTNHLGHVLMTVRDILRREV